MYTRPTQSFQAPPALSQANGFGGSYKQCMHCNMQGCHGHLWAACPVPDCEVARTYTPFCITMQSVYIHHI